MCSAYNFVVSISQESFTGKGLTRSIQNDIVPNDAISWSAENGYTSIVKLILEAGANPMANNYEALSLALHKKHMDVVEILLDSICRRRNANAIL